MVTIFGWLAAIVVVIYYVGVFVSLFVYPWRAGLGASLFVYPSAWMHEPSRRNGVPWILKTALKAFGWPLVLITWLVQEKPEPKVLYGFAAAERLGFTGDELPYHLRGFASKWKA